MKETGQETKTVPLAVWTKRITQWQESANDGSAWVLDLLDLLGIIPSVV